MKHAKVDIIFWQFDGGYCGDDTLTINFGNGIQEAHVPELYRI